MKTLRWKQKAVIDDEEKAKEIAAKFARTCKVGVELEGNSRIVQGNRGCGYASHYDCGICDSCPSCAGCTPNNHNTCAMRNSIGCIIYRENNNNSCQGCTPCNFCNRCQLCNPCNSCSGYRDILNNRSNVYEAIAEDLHCGVGKDSVTNFENWSGDFVYVYRDGSVNIELVTNAIILPRLSEVLVKGIETLEKYKTVMSPIEKAGAHQTFSFDGMFDHVMASNSVQIVRYYLPALVAISCVGGTQARSEYRKIPPVPGWSQKSTVFNDKYHALYVKSQLALVGSPKLLEFRFPDSHPRVNQHVASAIVNAAIIHKSILISYQGVASFEALHWRKVIEITRFVYADGFDNCDRGYIIELKKELLNFLFESIDKFITNADEFVSKVISWSIPPTDDNISKINFEWRANTCAE